ncbi:SemiSWEET family sugar transporter [Microvirga sp. CF3016]|uniref:SemiSWEET family sugar transporter n=1 Tax=Microvirga sp. CF3016 TaxID=3110181 RepID=UPI002E7A3EEC|nr:PQ-loop domain-containing transporter [Microvirga sp. CF3016]MEE1611908.1 PQ-loop domain-containing transporter [Microvirga sp. CF3016]
MDVSLSTLTGSAAGCIGLYSFVPQVVKCCRTSDVTAISLRMFAVRTFGLLLWTIYGFALGSLPVLIFSALGLVLSSVILVLKIRGSRMQLAGESCRQHQPDRKDASAAEPMTG